MSIKKLTLFALSHLFCQIALASTDTVPFTNELTLKGQDRLQVVRINERFNKKDNKWKVVNSKDFSQLCNFSISIQGRDIAIINQTVGEHYFGKMSVECLKDGSLFGTKEFKTTFERVLFLGSNQCVSSETEIDNDYCNLTVVALRKETEKTNTLIKETKSTKSYLTLKADGAKKEVVNKKYLPQGINLELYDTFQVFQLSVGKNGQDFFVKSMPGLSSLSLDRNHYLKIEGGGLEQDVSVAKKIDENIAKLYTDLQSIESAEQPQEEFRNKITPILTQYTATLKMLLGMVTPVEFYSSRLKILSFENFLLNTSKQFNPNITSRESFTVDYAADFSDYKKYIKYLNTNQNQSNTINTNNEKFETDVITIYRLNDYERIAVGLTTYYKNNKSSISFEQFIYLVRHVQYHSGARNKLIEAYYYDNKLQLDQVKVNKLIAELERYSGNYSFDEYSTRERILRNWNNKI